MKTYPHLQEMPETESSWFAALVNLARYLRSPDGCPWDRKQGASQFAAFTREESAELVEAFDKNSNADIEEEWGDTLFTLLASGVAAEQEGRFTLKKALERTHEKMIHRHGHIFGEYTATTPEDAMKVWEDIKLKEKEAKRQKSGG
jgi:tetrapyrrole methylase family protein / MazG family protein